MNKINMEKIVCYLVVLISIGLVVLKDIINLSKEQINILLTLILFSLVIYLIHKIFN